MKPELAARAVVRAVDFNAASRRLIKPADQVDDGAFAGACRADQCDGFAGLDAEVEVIKHLLAVLVLEADILKINISYDRRPVLPPGVEIVAKQIFHFLRILNVRLCIKQCQHALRSCLPSLKLRECGRDILNRMEEVRDITDKGGDGAKAHRAGQDEAGPLGQHISGSDCADRADDREKQGGNDGGVYRALVHL